MYKWNASKDFPDKENCRETCFSKTVTTEPDMVCTQGLQVRGERHTADSTYDLRFDVHGCGSTGGPDLNLDLSYTGPDGLRPLMGDVERAGQFVEWPYAGPRSYKGPNLAASPYAPNDALPLPIQGMPMTYGGKDWQSNRYKMQTARASCGRCKRIYESCQDATKRAARGHSTESECWLKEVQPCLFPDQTQPCQADEKQRMRYTGIGQRAPASSLQPLTPPPTRTTAHAHTSKEASRWLGDAPRLASSAGSIGLEEGAAQLEDQR